MEASCSRASACWCLFFVFLGGFGFVCVCEGGRYGKKEEEKGPTKGRRRKIHPTPTSTPNTTQIHTQNKQTNTHLDQIGQVGGLERREPVAAIAAPPLVPRLVAAVTRRRFPLLLFLLLLLFFGGRGVERGPLPVEESALQARGQHHLVERLARLLSFILCVGVWAWVLVNI